MTLADKIIWVLIALIYGGLIAYLGLKIFRSSRINLTEFQEPQLDDDEIISFHE